MKIRNFKPDDAALLGMIFHEAIHNIGSKDYSQDQVKAWSPRPIPANQFLTRVSDGRSIFVAVREDDKPIAFIELEDDGHIDCFYCHPDAAGTGVGKALYDRLEDAASTAGLSRLYVEASETARNFFLRAGFTIIRRQDFERNKVHIHNYVMEKILRR